MNALFQIFEGGFLPTIGAGEGEMRRHFGVSVPVVYTATTWKMASQYPIMPTTLPLTLPYRRKRALISGGSMVSMDGTPPLRFVFRCLVCNQDKLWGRDGQGAFMPKDIHITHLCIYAVRPDMCHAHHTSTFPIQRSLNEDRAGCFAARFSLLVLRFSRSLPWTRKIQKLGEAH